MRTLKLLLTCALGALAGCATVSVTSTQDITVHALDGRERPVAGLTCAASNEHGEQAFTSPSATVTVRRSFSELEIECRRGNEEVAKATVVPRRDRLEQALIPFGSVAVAIDHLTGRLYSYPTVVRIRIGKHLRFEHSTEAQAAADLGTLGDPTVADVQATPARRSPLPPAVAAQRPTRSIRATPDRAKTTVARVVSPPPATEPAPIIPGVNAPLTW